MVGGDNGSKFEKISKCIHYIHKLISQFIFHPLFMFIILLYYNFPYRCAQSAAQHLLLITE